MTRSDVRQQRPRRRATRAAGPAELKPGADASTGPAAAPKAPETPAPAAATERKTPTPSKRPSDSAKQSADAATADAPATQAAPATQDAPATKDTAEDTGTPAVGSRGRWLRWPTAAAAVLLVVALGAAVVLLALSTTADGLDGRRGAFVQTARQGVLNLTTVRYATAPEDVQHLLDGASGSFAQDFGGRKDSYIQVVQKAQVNSEGKVLAAGLEKLDGNTAVVLVASTAKVSNSSAPQGEERSYRLRVTVTDTDGRMTVSNVEFVP